MPEHSEEFEQAHRAVSLLLQAARIDPVLVEAVRKVDRYLHDVEAENDRLRAALRAAEQRAVKAALRSIEARNPGIDMDEVRAHFFGSSEEGDHG